MNNNLTSLIKKIAKEKESNSISYQEAQEGADNLVGFFDLLLKIDIRINAKSKKS